MRSCPRGRGPVQKLIGTFLEVFLSWSRAARHPQKAERLPEASHGLQMLPSCPPDCQSPARHTVGPGHHRPVCFHALPHFQAPPCNSLCPLWVAGLGLLSGLRHCGQDQVRGEAEFHGALSKPTRYKSFHGKMETLTHWPPP